MVDWRLVDMVRIPTAALSTNCLVSYRNRVLLNVYVLHASIAGSFGGLA